LTSPTTKVISSLQVDPALFDFPSSRRRPTTETMASWLLLLIVAIGCSSPVSAWIPPLRQNGWNESNWESVHDMRQRLGQTYNYTPTLLHPELCRYLTPEECRDHDVALRDHGRRHRQRIVQRKRALRERQLRVDRNLQIDHNPNLGNFKCLVLLIQFSGAYAIQL